MLRLREHAGAPCSTNRQFYGSTFCKAAQKANWEKREREREEREGRAESVGKRRQRERERERGVERESQN